jgi:glycolate oxidase iron-sulfur subunit
MQTQPFIALTHPEQRREAEAIIRTCVHCGFCNAACPTYQLLGDENDGPRGRIYLIKQVLEGTVASGKTRQHLDRCLTCRACETACPSGVQYGNLLDIGREVVERQAGRSWLETFKRRLLCAVLPYPGRFGIALGLINMISPLLPKALSQKLPAKRPISAKTTKKSSEYKSKVLLLDGCVQPVLAPDINAAMEAVFNKLGIGIIKAPSAGCCGALSYHLSYQEQGLNFMRRNIDAWLPYLDEGIETIITTASGCGVTIKEYGRFLKHDPAYRHKAERISKACKDICEVLETKDLTRLAFTITKKVAFQSPCSLQHGQKLNGKVEALLIGIGFNLTPVVNAHSCCGSAGSYSLLQPALAQRLLADKLSALESGHPDEIVTANIGCLLHLRSQASVPVRHWVELLAESMAENTA